jgi:hypothetical protein
MKKFTLLIAAIAVVTLSFGQSFQTGIVKHKLNANDAVSQRTAVDTLTYSSDVVASNIGYDATQAFTVVAYFPAATMATHSGNEINEIAIGVDPASLTGDVTVAVWTDTTGGAATPVTSETVPASSLTAGWNGIDLSTPYSIDGTAIFVGYSCTSIDYGLYMDDQAAQADGYGDLIYDGATWANTSGYGASFDHNFQIKGIVDDGVALADDAGLNSISAPSPMCGLTAAEDVTVEIENYGTADITGDLDIGYTINGGSEMIATYTGGLTAGATADFTFTVDMSANQAYEIVAYTKLSGDGLASNDTVNTITMNVAPITTYPYETTFDQASYDFLGWTFEDVNGDDNTWFPANGAGIGVDDDYALVYQWNSAAAADDWAYTSCMDLTAGSYVLSYQYKTAGGTTYPEEYEVFFGDDKTASAMTTELIGSTTLTDTAYTEMSVNFDVATDGVYYIGFHCISDADMYNLFLDNVVVDVYTDVNEHSKEIVNVFPNPANDVVYVENAENAQINVVNMVGQVVASKVADSNRVSINTADLAEGTYIIRIENGNEVSTQKLNVIR